VQTEIGKWNKLRTTDLTSEQNLVVKESDMPTPIIAIARPTKTGQIRLSQVSSKMNVGLHNNNDNDVRVICTAGKLTDTLGLSL